MHTVKVFNKNERVIPTHVEIDGKPLRCRHIEYHADPESIPIFVFDVVSLADIEVNHADICFKFHSDTVVDAVKILRHELLHNADLYNAFASSIKSALDEAKPYTSESDLARDILDRVIGEKNGS